MEMKQLQHCFLFLSLFVGARALDYADALTKSLLYFEAQRSGRLPYNQRVAWRDHSGLMDGLEQGVDLVGGYYDAGDHVKFGLPMAFTVTMLSWGVIDYRQQIADAGELGHALEAIKWGTDYFIKAHTSPNVLWAEVGDGDTDHYCWQRPEDMTTSRLAYKIDEKNPGSDLAGETAAAMAAASIVFKETNPHYSHLLLHHAQQLFEFGDKYRGKYDISVGVVKSYYASVSGYMDELLWGALWLYKATDNEDYLNYAIDNAHHFGGIGWSISEFSWDVKYAGIQIMASKVLIDSSDEKDGTSLVDWRGNPVDNSRTGGWLAAGLILGTELSERICVMGISMNMVTYLVGQMHLSTSQSANIVTNFMGTLNILALLGGFLADAKLGRYLTVAIFASITALGVTLLTLSTSIHSMRPPPCADSRKHQCIEANGRQLAMLYVALYTIALGGGGIKSNVSGFGSDQFDASNPKEQKAMIYFFNRFYFCISLGSLFAVTVLVYIQDNVGRGWGYGISAGTMIIAVAILLGGTSLYRFRKPQGSPLTVIWRVVFLAWKKRNLPFPSHASLLNEYNSANVPHTRRLRCLDRAAILDDHEVSNGHTNNSWIVSTVTQVEEVKMVLQLIPIWSTCILFWTIYSQMNTFTIEQATFMNRKVGSFLVPSGSFSFFLFITILLFTSLNERVFIPIARKITHDPQGIRSLQRIGIGLVFSVAGMVASAIIEKRRREMVVQENTRISAFWLVPQFFLVGAGEAFAYVGQLEFFIREAPERMKSMSTGLFLSTLAMGYFVSSLLVTGVVAITKKSWIRNNLNKGKLENFYWMLAVLGVINFFVFLAFAMRHQYKVHQYKGPANGQEKELENWKGEMIDDNEKKAGAEGKEEP